MTTLSSTPTSRRGFAAHAGVLAASAAVACGVAVAPMAPAELGAQLHESVHEVTLTATNGFASFVISLLNDFNIGGEGIADQSLSTLLGNISFLDPTINDLLGDFGLKDGLGTTFSSLFDNFGGGFTIDTALNDALNWLLPSITWTGSTSVYDLIGVLDLGKTPLTDVPLDSLLGSAGSFTIDDFLTDFVGKVPLPGMSAAISVFEGVLNFDPLKLFGPVALGNEPVVQLLAGISSTTTVGDELDSLKGLTLNSLLADLGDGHLGSALTGDSNIYDILGYFGLNNIGDLLPASWDISGTETLSGLLADDSSGLFGNFFTEDISSLINAI